MSTTIQKSTFSVPARKDVSSENQLLFDELNKKLGFVPNLYAYYAKNKTALSDYLTLQNRKSGLRAKEKEIVNLVVSQINQCNYCLAAHTAIAKMNGFSAEEIIEIRKADITFDAKFDALAKLVKGIVIGRGRVHDSLKIEFFEAGYSESQLIDIVLLIGDKTISNYIHNLAQFEIDFPAAATI